MILHSHQLIMPSKIPATILFNSITKHTNTIISPIYLLIFYIKYYKKFLSSFGLGYSTICFLILSQSSVVFTLVYPLFYHVTRIFSFLSIINIIRNIAYLVTIMINIANSGCIWEYSPLNSFINVYSNLLYWITIKTYQSLHFIIF